MIDLTIPLNMLLIDSDRLSLKHINKINISTVSDRQSKGSDLTKPVRVFEENMPSC